jgi:DNA (cytosine-5)-methyltransferase 1
MALHDPDNLPSDHRRKPLKIVDLFCGTGGFSLGAHAAGFDVVAAYDRDPILTSSFEANFPSTPLHLRNLAWTSGERLRRDAGCDVDGVIGGPPCQGFSEMGLRSKEDPRRQLLRHFFRLVADVDPKFFVMENVRGLGFPAARPTLDAALDLVRDRYDLLGPVAWDAASFGAATTRPRLFVIGIRKDLQRPMTREHVEAKMRRPATVEDAIADLEAARELEEDTAGFDHWRTTRPCRPSAYAANLRRGGVFTGHRPTLHTEGVKQRFATVLQGGFDKVGRHPRLAWNGQCPTLRAGTGSDRGSFQSVRPIHPEEDRVITVREAARLQGFPDDHRFHPTVWHSFRMIGNSVSPIIGEAVLAAVRERLAAQQSDGEPHSGQSDLLPELAAASVDG